MTDSTGDGAAWDFFVSYTQADRAWAEWIAWLLEEDGYRVLVQAWDMVAGSNWISRMDQGVQCAPWTVAVLSPDYLSSVYGTAEWQAAWADDPQGKQHTLITVRVRGERPAGLLAGVVGIDLVGLSAAAARRRLRDDITAAVRGRARPGSPPPFPLRAVPAEPRFPGSLPEVFTVPGRNPNFTDRTADNRPGASSPESDPPDPGAGPDGKKDPPPDANPDSHPFSSPPKPAAPRQSGLRAIAKAFGGKRLTVSAQIATILSLLVAVVALPVTLRSGPDLPSPPPSPTISAPSPSPALEFVPFDDFSGAVLDPAKWDGVDAAAPLLYARDGMLHLQTSPTGGPGESSAKLYARLPRPIRAVRFELTLLSVEGTNDGGAAAVVSRNIARNHKLGTGPDGSGAPVINYDICAREAGCREDVYNDFVRPSEVQIREQQRYEVVVRQDGARWVFEVDGVQQNTAELENGPIERLSYYLYSFGEGTFHATVDNVDVAYAT